MLPLEKSASASHGLCGNRDFHLSHDLLLRIAVVAAAGQLHEQVEAACAVLVGRIGQGASLGFGEPLQLQLAGSFGGGKTGEGSGIEAWLARQHAELFRCLVVMAGVVVGVSQGAQIGDGQCGLGSRLSELGARDLRLRAQRMRQQYPFEGGLGSLLLAERLLHFALHQLKPGAICGVRARSRRENLPRTGQVVHREQDVRLKLGRLVVEDALRIAAGESVQDVLRDGIVSGIVACLCVEKVRVVGELSVGAASLCQGRLGLGVALVEQVGVAKRKVSRCGGFAGVAVRVGGDSGVSRRRAQSGQLLGHGLQLF
jgi:hypothetical protein